MTPGRGVRIFAKVAEIFPAGSYSKDDLRDVYTEVCTRFSVIISLRTHGLRMFILGSNQDISSEAALPSMTAFLLALCDGKFSCCAYIVADAHADEGGEGCSPKGSQAGLCAAAGRAIAAQQRATILSSQQPLQQRSP